MKLVRLNGAQTDRQAVRNSHRCQLSGLATSSLLIICLFVVPFLKGTGGPAPSDPVCLPTQEGRRRLLNQPPFTGETLSQRAAASAFSSVFLEHVCRARLCLRGKVFLSLFFVMQPTSLSVCVLVCVLVCMCVCVWPGCGGVM